jgi:hypothetical protein
MVVRATSMMTSSLGGKLFSTSSFTLRDGGGERGKKGGKGERRGERLDNVKLYGRWRDVDLKERKF